MKQRNAQYEFIRTVAMIQVVLLHTLNNLPQNNEELNHENQLEI